MNEEKSNVPTLDTDNYEVWAVRLEALLMKKGCWEAIQGFDTYIHVDQNGVEREIEDENALPHHEVKRRMRMEQQARALIIQYVDDSFLDDIIHLDTAKEIWETLCEICTTYDVLQEIIFLKEMVNTEKTEDISMMQYMSKIQNYNKKIAKCGINLPDRALAAFYLMGIPREKYAEFIRSIYRTNEGDITSKYVKSQLLLEEKRMRSENGNPREDHKLLKVSKKTNGKDKPNLGKIKTKTQSNLKSSVNEKNVKRYICFTCGKEGHISKFCPAIAECKSRSEVPIQKEKASATVVSRGYKVLCMQQNRSQPDDGIWILDSAASDHMSPHLNLFENLTPFSGEVTVGDGKTLQIEGKGSVQIHMSDECGGWTIKLTEVLYIPNLQDNLISEGRLEDKGMSIIRREGKTTVYDGEESIFIGFRVGFLYYVTSRGSISIEEMKKEAEIYEDTRTCRVTSNVWHSRLGHLHKDAIEKIESLEKLKSEKAEYVCETCIRGKLKRQMFPHNDEEYKKEVGLLDRVHSDVVGPMPCKSLGGCKYFVTFIDEYLHYIMGILIKNKSDVPRVYEIS